jgi:tetratricopeptide (TPR) repeat protein
MAGHHQEAEAIYLELLEINPDDVEVLFQLGFLRWAYNWRQGRSQAEAVEPLTRVLELAPRHRNAAIYLMWSLAAAGDVEGLDSLEAKYGGASDPAWHHAKEAIRSYRTGDATGAQEAMDSLAAQGSSAVLPLVLVLHGIQNDLVPDLERITAFLRRPLTDPSLLAENKPGQRGLHQDHILASIILATAEAGRGRWSAGQEVLKELDSLTLTPAVAYRASLATALPDRIGGDDIPPLQLRVEAWDPPSIQVVRDSVPFGPDNLHNLQHGKWGPFLRAYLAGLLKSQIGDYRGALEDAARLEAMAPNEVFPLIHEDLARGIRADVLFREGELDEALAVLDRSTWAVNHNEVIFAPTVGGVREVFLRARVLHELGRYQEALDLYAFGAEGRHPGVALLAPSHRYRGEIYEAMGDSEKALWHYGAFVELWRDADPEYQPTVEDVRGRIARLAAEE